jgi:undecaprenyl-diphosphatase
VDAVAWLLSWPVFGVACFVVAAALALGAWRWRATLALALGTGAADLVGDRVLRPWFGRMRPCYALPAELVHRVGEGADLGSIPSLHAANFFAMAFVVTASRPRLGPIAYALATAVAWSRIQVGVHWPTDVLAGALWGTLCGAIAWRALAPRQRPPARGAAAPDERSGGVGERSDA